MNRTTILIDPVVRRKAAERASKDALSMSAVMRILLNGYSEGRIVIQANPRLTANGFTPEFEAETMQALREAEQGKHVSKLYKNKRAFFRDLKKVART